MMVAVAVPVSTPVFCWNELMVTPATVTVGAPVLISRLAGDAPDTTPRLRVAPAPELMVPVLRVTAVLPQVPVAPALSPDHKATNSAQARHTGDKG